MKEYPALSSILLLAIAATPSWAKPKAEIAVEVVSVAVALSHSPSYHPAIPDTSTTVCTPNGEKCTTTPTPGHPASIDNLEYYSHFIYAIFPDGRHVTLQYEGFKLIYPLSRGNTLLKPNRPASGSACTSPILTLAIPTATSLASSRTASSALGDSRPQPLIRPTAIRTAMSRNSGL
jgi:hypothetical protein